MNLEGGPEENGPSEGRYANYFKVGCNAFEFLVDFGQFYPESATAQLHTRIIILPVYAKALLDTLRASIERYEQTFGSVPREGTGETQNTG